jgi:hypothetical protein
MNQLFVFYFDDKFPEVMFYYPATLDGGMHPGHAKEAEHHVHVGSKANWESFEDSLPRHDEGLDQAVLMGNKCTPRVRCGHISAAGLEVLRVCFLHRRH